MMRKQSLLLGIGISFSISAIAEETQLPSVYVTGGEALIETTPGSAHLMDEQQLETFEYKDVHQVLATVPGVYVRNEDGYGLRPNIGMRGTPSERSQKITIMEDGILIAPAPYAAPAAYYFPSVARMENVEVFKGPSSILYGPHTVGGALNMVTTSIPEQAGGQVEAAYGSFGDRKLHAQYGSSNDRFGWMIEGLNLGSQGFKDLDNGGDTGFNRSDLNAKLRFNINPDQRLDIKLGYADDTSDETYLGLTDEDFKATPYRRYAASQLDKFEAEQHQLHLTHFIQLNETTNLTTRVYQNNFERAWNKFEDFHRGNNVHTVLADPENILNRRYYRLLTGAHNSTAGNDFDLIDVTDNQRDYVSRGIELSADKSVVMGDWLHEVTVGARLHQDKVERHHTLRSYAMQDGVMVYAADKGESSIVRNEGAVDAAAFYIQDKAYYGENWTFTLGMRSEMIESEFTNFLDASENNRSEETVWLPGLGVFYQFNDNLGFLAGVNKGFSPNSPQANSAAEPEEAINTEAGLRYNSDQLQGELIGFFSNYSNLVGRCRNADSGCVVGTEYNGGDVQVGGMELTLNAQPAWGQWQLPLGLTYTYTESAFQDAFTTAFSQWGAVSSGDELPYLPAHQLRLQGGLMNEVWRLNVALNYTSEMREQAGQGDISQVDHTASLATIDTSATYFLNHNTRLQLSITNLTDEVSVASRRPFGARPNKPRTISAGVKYEF